MNTQSTSSTEISVDQLKRDWEQLHPLDRAQAVARIRRSGMPIRQIARQVGRSEAMLRRLLVALKAPVADLLLARQGTLSVNELVHRARAEAARQAALRQADRKRNRKIQAVAGSRVICDWIQQHQFSGASGEQIIQEAHRIIVQEHFAGKLPVVDPPDHPVPAAIIIERCKPKEPLDAASIDIDWYGKWLARWVVFALPDPDVRDDALDMALEQQWKR